MKKTLLLTSFLINLTANAQDLQDSLLQEMIFEQSYQGTGTNSEFNNELNSVSAEDLNTIRTIQDNLESIDPKINRLIFEDGTVLIIKRRGGDMGGG